MTLVVARRACPTTRQADIVLDNPRVSSILANAMQSPVANTGVYKPQDAMQKGTLSSTLSNTYSVYVSSVMEANETMQTAIETVAVAASNAVVPQDLKDALSDLVVSIKAYGEASDSACAKLKSITDALSLAYDSRGAVVNKEPWASYSGLITY